MGAPPSRSRRPPRRRRRPAGDAPELCADAGRSSAALRAALCACGMAWCAHRAGDALEASAALPLMAMRRLGACVVRPRPRGEDTRAEGSGGAGVGGGSESLKCCAVEAFASSASAARAAADALFSGGEEVRVDPRDSLSLTRVLACWRARALALGLG